MSKTIRFPVENKSLVHFDSIQLSGPDHNNKHILSVIVKKTYGFSANGVCNLEGVQQVPLNLDATFADDNELLIDDTDLYLNKKFTDLIIKGKVSVQSPAAKSQISVQVGGQKEQLNLSIFGRRIAYQNSYGKIQFTEPEQLAAIPLEYTHAYGGIDIVAEQNFDDPNRAIYEAVPGFDWKAMSPYRYPRNPCGKGYLIENNLPSIENFELPHIEDPRAILTPLNLLVGKPENWIYKPLARCTSWVNPTWFPRFGYFGVVPEFDTKATFNQIPEFYQRLADPDIFSNKKIGERFSYKAANGASLGLQFPLLNGNESIRLTNIHPHKADFILQLPADHPRIWADGRKGKLLPTSPVIQTIIVDAEKSRISIVWRGSAPALRPYSSEELKTMPYQVEW